MILIINIVCISSKWGVKNLHFYPWFFFIRNELVFSPKRSPVRERERLARNQEHLALCSLSTTLQFLVFFFFPFSALFRFYSLFCHYYANNSETFFFWHKRLVTSFNLVCIWKLIIKHTSCFSEKIWYLFTYYTQTKCVFFLPLATKFSQKRSIRIFF